MARHKFNVSLLLFVMIIFVAYLHETFTGKNIVHNAELRVVKSKIKSYALLTGK